jgi:MFS family permease
MSDGDRAQLRGRGLVVRSALGATATTGASMLPVALISALVIQLRGDIDLTTVQLGATIAGFSGVAALTSIPAGRLVDRLGWIRGIWLAAVLLAIPMLAIGTLARTFGQVFVLFLVAGLGNAVAQPSANLAIIRGVPTDRQGFAFGLKQAAVPAGSVMAGFAVPLIGLTIGWRYAFIASAVVVIAIAFTAPWASRGRRGTTGGALRFRAVLGDRALLLMTLANYTSAMGLNALFAFLVEASVARGIEPATAGLLLSLAGVLGAASRLIVGWLSDRFARTAQGMLLETACYAAIGATGMFVLGRLGTTVPSIAVGLLLASGFGFAWSGQFNLVVTRVWRATPAAATGVAQTGLWVGGMLGPLLFGYVAANISYTLAFFIGGGFMSMTPCFLLLARRRLIARGDG